MEQYRRCIIVDEAMEGEQAIAMSNLKESRKGFFSKLLEQRKIQP